MASSLLPLAFGDVEPRERLVLLDLGSPTPEGIRFLNQFDCTVCYAGVRDRMAKMSYSESGDPPDFSKLIGVEYGTRFDVCLMWDCLNFIDFETLSLLGGYLDDFVTKHTRMHAFLAFSKEMPLAISRFRMLNKVEIDMTEFPGTSCPYPRTAQDMANGFASHSVRRGILLKNNRREVFFGDALGGF